MDRVAGDAFAEFTADRARCGTGGIGGADQGPEGFDGPFPVAFQYGSHHGARGHEPDEVFEKGFAAVYGIEPGGPVAAQKIHFQGPDAESVRDQSVEDFARGSGCHGVGLDEGEGSAGRLHGLVV